MTAGKPLGHYLRARRELVRPEAAGLPEGGGRRRVSGLRRSEVAQLAGISTEYYVKLEQGREVHPTDQVLVALSRALQLDATATSYLRSLARLPELPAVPAQSDEHARVRWLIDSWPHTAAIIHDRHNDIIASNALMLALVPAFRSGENSLVALLLEPSVRLLYGDEWEGLAARSVALLRTNAGLPPYAERTEELVAMLSRDSELFRTVWPRNDVYGGTSGVHRITHPSAGALTLHFARLPLAGPADHSIFLYYAEPGSPTAAALSELAAQG